MEGFQGVQEGKCAPAEVSGAEDGLYVPVSWYQFGGHGDHTSGSDRCSFLISGLLAVV